MTNIGSTRVRFGPYTLDLQTGELWKDGVRLKLAGQPFEILALLITRPGRLITREELRFRLWPEETFVDFNHGLNTAVNKLRQVLCDAADKPKYIETLPRRGYRFMAPVEEPPATLNTQSAADLSEPASPRTGEEPLSADAMRPTLRVTPLLAKPRFWVLYAAIAAAVLASLWLAKDRLHLPSATGATGAAEASAPIKLRPITSLSDRTSQPAFSPDGTRVAFLREGFLPGKTGIWSKRLDGDELVQLTSNSSDCCPVWSPDGQSVAFSRFSGGRRKVFEVSSHGDNLHELFATASIPGHGELDWSPDGKAIVYVAAGAQGSPAIFLYAPDSQTFRQFTMPSALDEDSGPAFSPDGTRIAFVRKNEIMVATIGGNEIHSLAKSAGRVIGSPAWTPDGESIIFAAIDSDGPSLMRVRASGGKPVRLRDTGGAFAWDPAISRRGFRLACDQLTVARIIDQIDLTAPSRSVRELVTTASGENAGVQISHDGAKLVFQSDRAGESDIWISDRDGQNPVRMTALGTATAPRWSPDDKVIAFEARSRPGGGATAGIFLVKSSGGNPGPLLQDSFSNRAPHWSNDGKWIYFGSNRSGEWQVWKLPAWGGSPIQVTHHGGFAAEESPDGKYLYYVKQNRNSPEIWRMPAGGGREAQPEVPIHPLDWAAWSIVKNGLLFVGSGSGGDPTVNLFDFSSQEVKPLAAIDKPPFWLTASRDGKSVLFDQPGQPESHAMLLENFR